MKNQPHSVPAIGSGSGERRAGAESGSGERGAFLFLSDHSGFHALPTFLGPDLSVLQGETFFVFFPVGGTDGNGQLNLSFTAPSDPRALGLVGHLQAALLPGDPTLPPILSNAISGVVRE